MALRWVAALVLGQLVLGCATARVVRLETGDGANLVYKSPGRLGSTEIREDAFRQSLVRLVLDARLALRAEEASRSRIRFASTAGARVSSSLEGHAGCARWEDPEECLFLLADGGSLLDHSGRRRLALSFAWDGVWDGVEEAVREVTHPLALKAMVTSALAAYMLLVVAPEPVTKLVAIALTVYVVAYIGLDAFTELVSGWQVLSWEVERAVSFAQLEAAGHRFGTVMGANGARVLILALTAVLGGGAANLASKGPALPGFARAALAAETNAGLRLTAAMTGGVRSLTVSESGLTVAVAPTAVATVAWDGAPGSTAAGAPPETPATELRQLFSGLRSVPGYPPNFKAAQNGTARVRVNNKALLEKLREVEPGVWNKVYRNRSPAQAAFAS
ncbi:hypothetical protein [Myxococcus xanthus]|uniref:SitA5 family polymorphic toxin n=1 Tax=Myxococcus xanthus TaxID=34 RepID=UPI00112DC79C|nr:hypothetical protein [Myxococcus xanthus]